MIGVRAGTAECHQGYATPSGAEACQAALVWIQLSAQAWSVTAFKQGTWGHVPAGCSVLTLGSSTEAWTGFYNNASPHTGANTTASQFTPVCSRRRSNWQGCYKNEGVHKIRNHTKTKTALQCKEKAQAQGYAYYGMEHPEVEASSRTTTWHHHVQLEVRPRLQTHPCPMYLMIALRIPLLCAFRFDPTVCGCVYGVFPKAFPSTKQCHTYRLLASGGCRYIRGNHVPKSLGSAGATGSLNMAGWGIGRH